jgi:hypothetical protein
LMGYIECHSDFAGPRRTPASAPAIAQSPAHRT